MSATIGSADYAFRSYVLAQSDQVRAHLDTLTSQVTSGLVSTSYGGLGAGARTALDLAPVIARNTTTATDITIATGSIGVAQNALTQASSIATTFLDKLPLLNGLNPTALSSIASDARDALAQVGSLLNSTDGGTYVFAGQDSTNPPVPNPEQIASSGFFTQISAAVASLGASATTTIASTLATASSTAAGTSPFSASLEALAASGDGRATVETGSGSRVPGVPLANRNGDVASPAGSTTGSYFRDLLRSLATLGALTPAQQSAGAFGGLIQDVTTSLGGVVTALNQDAGVLGDRQAGLTTTATNLTSTNTALSSQLGSIEDVDAAQTATDLSLVQTQLQASYRVIAGLNTLSLVAYL